jgi:hypothetical protein
MVNTAGEQRDRLASTHTTPGEFAEVVVDSVCPICAAPVHNEKCKVVCRSARCVYRVIMTCAEF